LRSVEKVRKWFQEKPRPPTHTPMDDVALVEVVNCLKDLSDGL
jgi:hypothetical protein